MYHYTLDISYCGEKARQAALHKSANSVERHDDLMRRAVEPFLPNIWRTWEEHGETDRRLRELDMRIMQRGGYRSYTGRGGPNFRVPEAAAPGSVLSAIVNIALVTIKEEPTDNDAQVLLNADSTHTWKAVRLANGVGAKPVLVDTLRSALTAAVTVQAREAQLEADVALYRSQAERLATRERFQVQAARKDAELAEARYQWAQERIRVLETNTEKERVAREMREVQALLEQEKMERAQGEDAGRAAQETIASLRAERDRLQTELQTARDAVASVQAQWHSAHERELKAEIDKRERAERVALELGKKLVRLQVDMRSQNTALREQVETLTKELEGERAECSARREQLVMEVSSLRVQLKAANEDKTMAPRDFRGGENT
ncbi:uncharacterized protein B0H18DRAFT_1108824, partial [Fomitopsis serialis]|uniref:uncharacterized protein n=1 Tax=Fomitopsis serialis TaxID=139415 RepID=UPI002007DFD9